MELLETDFKFGTSKKILIKINMEPFTIIRMHRMGEDTNVEQASGCPQRKIIKKQKPSTKNNIHHYKAVIKKILLTAKHNQQLASSEHKKVINSIEAATSMESFIKSIRSKKISRILLRAVDSGKFVRLLLESDIGGVNKVYTMRYLNSLFNGLKTGQLKQWIVDDVKEQSVEDKQERPFRELKECDCWQIQEEQPKEIIEDNFTYRSEDSRDDLFKKLALEDHAYGLNFDFE